MDHIFLKPGPRVAVAVGTTVIDAQVDGWAYSHPSTIGKIHT
jgi:hypothetical protein